MKIKNIKIHNGVLKRYADLSYDEWYAIAEFVDNSLHSFMEHKSDLKKLGTQKCEVDIHFLDKGNTIKILDNAGGIHPEDFQRLLTLGEPKPRAKSQLSEFGMGMKTAGIWLGNYIELETKSYLSDKAYKITLDVNKAGTDEEVTIEEVKASSNFPSYTKVTISDLNRKIKRKKKTIEEALVSIYRKYIESDNLLLKIDGIAPKNITYSILRDQSGALRKKNFTIRLKSGVECNGFVAIMEKGKTRAAGFSIYRYDRLIRGYPENLWKPREIFGQEGGSNLRRSQRLFGELDMTQFKVSHTKNRINYVGEEEDEFRKLLLEACEDLMQIADMKNDLITSTVAEHDTDIDLIDIKETTEDFINNSDHTDIVDEMRITSPSIQNSVPKLCKEVYESQEPFMNFEQLKHVNGFKNSVKVYHIKKRSMPYMIMDLVEGNLVVCINILHEYYVYLFENKGKQGLQEFHLNCVFDAIAELNVQTNNYGSITSDEIRIAKDMFMRNFINNHSL